MKITQYQVMKNTVIWILFSIEKAQVMEFYIKGNSSPV